MRIPWRKSAAPTDADRETRAHEASQVDAIEILGAQLRERGVTDPDARSLAEHLAPQVAHTRRAGRETFIDGIAAGWHAASESRVRLDRTVSEIKEVERLMGAFTGELSKLDEVLEVLAAYVRRMRTSKKVESSAGEILH